MTDEFFGKTLAVRKVEAIPGMLEFDIPVHGDNRGWFKENFQKEKMLPLGFPESFFALVNDYWALELKSKYAFVNYADPSLGIEWENLAEAEVSEADKNHPLLKDVKPLKKEDL